MNDIQILEAVEKYLRGEMNADEKQFFETLRTTNPEVDQMVVEHTLFLEQVNRLGKWKKFKTTLHDIHAELAQKGKIESARLQGKAKIINLWKRYKRVASIAAVIAGVTTLGVTALVNILSPKAESEKVTQLVNEVKSIKESQKKLTDIVTIKNNPKSVINTPIRYNGTGFLIDGKGYLVTNAHVVKNSKNIYVQNNKGEQLRVKVILLDIPKDIAILKIDDPDFKPFTSLPYSIRKSNTDIAEPIFTLGFPRNEIVYGEGYLSAKTGFNGDTLSCQIAVAANPGNSGGPVFNQYGEVIGILSTKEIQTEGAVFAIQSRYIYKALEELKKDTAFQNIRMPSNSLVRGLDKVQQVKRIQDYIFMVKGD